jgi:peptide chain release factor 3
MRREVHLFERTTHGAYRAPVQVGGIDDEFVRARMSEGARQLAIEELAMLDGAGHEFDREAVRGGEQTPVFFGSAANNFGVQLLLDTFLQHSAPPQPRSSRGTMIDPAAPQFSGFVFKIQANMDPRHRDRICFIRIVSGRFERDMQVIQTRTGKTVRLSNSQKLFARERETVDEAFAGDVIGVVGNHGFQIGDTLAQDPEISYDEIPRFPPSVSPTCAIQTPPSRSASAKVSISCFQEGVVQSFSFPNSAQRIPLLGAVGPLQFEVVQARLESEYAAEAQIETAPWQIVRWLRRKDGTPVKGDGVTLPSGTALAIDEQSRPVALFPGHMAAPLLSRAQSGARHIRAALRRRRSEERSRDRILSSPWGPPERSGHGCQNRRGISSG